MSRSKDITNQRFGKLIALKPSKERTSNRTIKWICKCDCGNEINLSVNALTTGNTTSCGCKAAFKTKHGLSRNRTYKTWYDMHNRCNNPKRDDYKYYGGRNIKVCKRWDVFQNFLHDMGEKPKGMTLDRINNDKNYKPNNCRWASVKTQNGNKRRPANKKGYWFNKSIQRWVVYICINGKTRYINSYKKERNAARKARKIRKENPETTNS